MSVPIQAGAGFNFGNATRLFDTSEYASGLARTGRNYDISRDGRRFLMIKDEEQSSTGQINVVLNWHEELKRLVPVN